VKLNSKAGYILEFKSWADKIKNKFEECFWIPTDVKEDSKYKINAKLVHRRGIYKDVYKSSQEYTDYQLRPNVCIALSYAPELFDRNHAV
jgi:glycogen debranching enzyme